MRCWARSGAPPRGRRSRRSSTPCSTRRALPPVIMYYVEKSHKLVDGTHLLIQWPRLGSRTIVVKLDGVRGLAHAQAEAMNADHASLGRIHLALYEAQEQLG